jgi:hypothetical protein
MKTGLARSIVVASRLTNRQINVIFIFAKREPGSSVSTVSGYGLDDGALEVRFPAEKKGFFPVAFVSRPALGPTQPPVQWVPGVLSPGVKRGQRMSLITHPHLVPRTIMSRTYTFSPPKRLRGVQWNRFSFRMRNSVTLPRLVCYTAAVLESQPAAQLSYNESPREEYEW